MKTNNPDDPGTAPCRGGEPATQTKPASRSETVKDAVDLMSRMREQGDPAETRKASEQVSESLLDHYMDRWRNDKKNGYNTIFKNLDLLREGETITDITYDDHPQFREMAKQNATHFVDKLTNSHMKISPGFLSERVSHGPNHAYRIQLEAAVDDRTEDMAERIFGVKLNGEVLTMFRNVAGYENRQVSDQKRIEDGLKPTQTDFWYLVRMGYQKGEIKSREDLARFTLDQMKRYG